ncbi:hypothetical protein [Natronorubrum halophilum]|uniref:hypothetical protein n=1 Tax=Natronorubrum halophilum TaxID=1702106 RepID=UPI0010C1CA89|nr:hypothetical protein [Natronorubrum halophilum]
MNRRDILCLGTGICVSVTAGCLGSNGDSAGSNADDESLWTTGSTDEQDSNDSGSPDDDPTAQFTIGDPSETGASHTMYVRNETDDERSITIQIDRDGESVLDRTEDVPADAFLEIVLAESGTYEAAVESETMRTTTSITRPDDDCEESRTLVTLRDGGIETDTSIRC